METVDGMHRVHRHSDRVALSDRIAHEAMTTGSAMGLEPADVTEAMIAATAKLVLELAKEGELKAAYAVMLARIGTVFYGAFELLRVELDRDQRMLPPDEQASEKWTARDAAIQGHIKAMVNGIMKEMGLSPERWDLQRGRHGEG